MCLEEQSSEQESGNTASAEYHDVLKPSNMDEDQGLALFAL